MDEIALYSTSGPRQAKHCLVLYLAAFTEWGSRQKARNGNKDMPLASAPHTSEVDRYCDGHWRTQSLCYNGKPPQDAAGLQEDLERFGYDSVIVQRFVEAAKPYWPKV